MKKQFIKKRKDIKWKEVEGESGDRVILVCGWVVFSFEELNWHGERTNSGLGRLQGSERGMGRASKQLPLLGDRL